MKLIDKLIQKCREQELPGIIKWGVIRFRIYFIRLQLGNFLKSTKRMKTTMNKSYRMIISLVNQGKRGIIWKVTVIGPLYTQGRKQFNLNKETTSHPKQVS